MRIGMKLIGGFLIVALIAAAIGVVGIANLNKLKTADTHMYAKVAEPLGLIARFGFSVNRIRGSTLNLFIVKDAASVKDLVDSVQARRKEMDAALKAYPPTMEGAQDERQFAQLQQDYASFNSEVDNIFSLIAAGKKSEAVNIAQGNFAKVLDVLNASLNQMILTNINDARSQSGVDTALADQAILAMTLVVVLALIVSLLFGFLLSRSITRPLARAVALSSAIAKGDLREEVAGTFLSRKDELGTLAHSLSEMTISLRDVVVAVTASAGSVASGSSQISTTAQGSPKERPSRPPRAKRSAPRSRR